MSGCDFTRGWPVVAIAAAAALGSAATAGAEPAWQVAPAPATGPVPARTPAGPVLLVADPRGPSASRAGVGAQAIVTGRRYGPSQGCDADQRLAVRIYRGRTTVATRALGVISDCARGTHPPVALDVGPAGTVTIAFVSRPALVRARDGRYVEPDGARISLTAIQWSRGRWGERARIAPAQRAGARLAPLETAHLTVSAGAGTTATVAWTQRRGRDMLATTRLGSSWPGSPRRIGPAPGTAAHSPAGATSADGVTTLAWAEQRASASTVVARRLTGGRPGPRAGIGASGPAVSQVQVAAARGQALVAWQERGTTRLCEDPTDVEFRDPDTISVGPARLLTARRDAAGWRPAIIAGNTPDGEAIDRLSGVAVDSTGGAALVVNRFRNTRTRDGAPGLTACTADVQPAARRLSGDAWGEAIEVPVSPGEQVRADATVFGPNLAPIALLTVVHPAASGRRTAELFW